MIYLGSHRFERVLHTTLANSTLAGITIYNTSIAHVRNGIGTLLAMKESSEVDVPP